jgi:5'-nucleotidase
MAPPTAGPPRLLLTNDDGVRAEGLRALAERLRPLAEVVVVAPDREQSACGHALTLHRPLRMEAIDDDWYAVDGTPTDCVNLAVRWLLRERPVHMVVSGINAGLNLGDDITYSGTVSAAFEGHLLGLPAIAFSQDLEAGFCFERSAGHAAGLVETLLKGQEASPPLLNVNLPAREPTGAALTTLGKRTYRQVVVERGDPRGRRYFWIGGTPEWQAQEGSDHEAVGAGRVSITPLHLDLTDHTALAANDAAGKALRQLAETL